MNVILNTPIPITLQSALLIQESDGFGTLQFRILEQPVTLSFTSSDYHYDTIFQEGDRVKLIHAFGSFAIDSEGILQKIIIDVTQDAADVYFDTIYPNLIFSTTQIVDVQAGDVSVLVRVPLSYLAKI